MTTVDSQDIAATTPPESPSDRGHLICAPPLSSALVVPELLEEIFFHCANECWSAFSDQFQSKRRAPPIKPWVQVTHVCRHWRDVALSFPRLWNRIILNFPGMARTCLDRSQGVPLYVWRFERTAFTDEEQDAFVMVIFQLYRIRELHLNAYGLIVRSYLGTSPHHNPAPQLKRCVLRGNQYPTVLNFLLARDLSSLEELEIPFTYIGCSWYTLPLPATLKSLVITVTESVTLPFNPLAAQAHPPQERFTNLRSLIIRDRAAPGLATDPLPRIAFRQLKRFEVSFSHYGRLRKYFQSFDFPPTMMIRLYTQQRLPIKKVLDLCHCPPPRSVIIDHPSESFCKFSACPKIYTVSELEDKSDNMLFRFRYNRGMPSVLDTPSNFAQVLRDVETLCVFEAYQLAANLIHSVKQHAPNVRNLGLNKFSAKTILREEEGESFWEWLPKLECITLRGGDWDKEYLSVVLGRLQEKADTGTKLPGWRWTVRRWKERTFRG